MRECGLKLQPIGKRLPSGTSGNAGGSGNLAQAGIGGRNQEPAPPFAEGVSEEQQPRMFRLIDALSKAMIPLGWELTADLKFAMGQDSVTLMFSESTDKILHTPTKEENLKLLQYE